MYSLFMFTTVGYPNLLKNVLNVFSLIYIKSVTINMLLSICI